MDEFDKKVKTAPSLLNRTAVRRAALAACVEAFGEGKVEGVAAGLYKDCELAVRVAIRRAVEQHRRGNRRLDGCVVLDATTPARLRRRRG